MSSSKPLRITVPLLIDVVLVSDADQIRKIETSGTVDRLHAYKTSALPWWVRLYFRSTKFHDDQRDLWFCPLESKSNPTYAPRRAYLEERVAIGYCPEDVQHIADLLNSNASDETLAHAMVQIVNQRFFGAEIPQSITQTAKHTIQNFGEALVPWKYEHGVEAQHEVMKYCEHALPKGTHILDAGHNIGEVVQTTTGALRTLKENLDTPVEILFTEHPLTLNVPRIATVASTIDGLLSSPTIPGETVFIFEISKAAKQTHDLNFTFGAGSSDRTCVFKDMFMAFMIDLQQTLRKTHARASQ